MTSKDETFCRLCAEPTPLEQLITTSCPVGENAKISMKMLWINIDTTNNLPTTICFSCFDLLERTWKFLHDVRTAQEKLLKIFSKNETPIEIKTDEAENIGKPVDKNWEEFQKPKVEVKDENSVQNVQIITVDPNTILDVDVNLVKCENVSDLDTFNDDLGGFDSADSDLPLTLAVKKKKMKKKSKRKNLNNEEPVCLDSASIWNAPLNVNTLDAPMTWEEYTWRCASCDAQCKNISSLRLHSLQIHSCCCTFKCVDCDKVINNYRTFINHVRTHKKSLRYCCEFCNKRYMRSAYIKKHINSEHGESYLTMCGNCGAVFETLEELKDHMLLYSKGLRKRTVKQENIESELKCEHCGKEFKSRSNLLQHKLVHTERTRQFSCHVCGKMFFTKGTLSTHMMTHEDTKPFKCEFCPMAFRARGNLQSHISLHSGAKPFVCEQCGKSFRVKRHLKSHSIVHTDLMPYVCEYCNKAFRFKTRLNLHLRQHTGAKPYTCLFCQRDFTNGSNFKKHMRRRHNIDTSKKRYNNIVDEPNSLGDQNSINDQNSDDMH
ncbi:gastrula zinc finger protein XlCGF26.1-like [Amyelois transitella]|uniref:gastrula zinc finger protein XlCGF26.1-like n=1 Tax=Amyelois transitella TaxID=680683 RepID=UPI00298FC31E|nr:gastrula zinc finger protein XlCGF26.1-like [Amyelois transitella]